ncbi:hypothetical protein PC117_g18502 [Phytophthora cactorum]|uniref:RxLR effector protein n=1 Tax=Phytophthora cactorum TaxID=29920 RepID=A0A8T1C019_9STRA|nr:hypothetical protein PC117_g18502 [Phytophthora cactorum]
MTLLRGLLIWLFIINAFALLKPTTSSISTLREFKRRIADTLTSNEKNLRQQRLQREKKRPCEALDEVYAWKNQEVKCDIQLSARLLMLSAGRRQVNTPTTSTLHNWQYL